MRPNEVRDDYESKLGKKLGHIFYLLWNDCADLLAIWKEFNELYGTSEDRVALLNKSASYTFHVIQQTMWDAVLLHLRRITDPTMSCGRENMTIQQLPALLRDPVLALKVEGLTKAAVAQCQFARVISNRRIAHSDLETVSGTGSTQLPSATRSEVNSAILSIHAVLNAISMDLMDSEMCPEPIIGNGGALSLLYVLRDGTEANSARRARIKSGTYLPEDMERRPTL